MTINFESIKELLGNIVIDVSNSFKIITELRHRLNNQNDFESVKNDLNGDMKLRVPLRPDISVLSDNFKSFAIIHDDFDLPLGEFKLEQNRGSAGHKGVQSTISSLKNKNFLRCWSALTTRASPAASTKRRFPAP